MNPRPQSSTTQSRYFNPDKTKTDSFFKQTKVESCHHIVVRNGISYAITYNIKNAKNQPLNSFNKNLAQSQKVKSVYRKDYEPKPLMHAGMPKKPLVPYQPTSYRNRLPIEGITMEYKNKTHFDIGNSNLVNRKQWLSTSKDFYNLPKQTPISNPGILSDIAKRVHIKRDKIN